MQQNESKYLSDDEYRKFYERIGKRENKIKKYRKIFDRIKIFDVTLIILSGILKIITGDKSFLSAGIIACASILLVCLAQFIVENS